MERLTAQYSPLFRQLAHESAQLADTPTTEAIVQRIPPVEQRRLDRSARREALYHQVKALREQGGSLDFIAGQTGLSQRTIQRFVKAEQFPARARRRAQPCQTDAFESYLRERIASGFTNAAQLYRDIKIRGYPGCYSSVSCFVSRFAKSLPGSKRAGSPANRSREIPASRAVAWWLQGRLSTRQLEVAQQQQAFLEALFKRVPVFQEVSELAQSFVALIKCHSSEDLPFWLERACHCNCSEIRQFAQGLKQDLPAIENAVSLCWSNGQTEGQVNRLKMIKRQMYGRAKFDLLRARVMPRARAV